MDEAGFFQHPSTVEDRRNLSAPKDNTLVAKEFNTRTAQLQYCGKTNKSLTQASGDHPTFSFLAIEGWSCSSGRFNLRKWGIT